MSESRQVKTIELQAPPPQVTDFNDAALAALRNDEIMFQGEAPLNEQTDEQKLDAILAECGDSGNPGFVSVWKIGVSKQFEFVSRIEASEFHAQGLPFLAKNYGAGTYELRIYNGKSQLVRRPKILISEAAARTAVPVGAGGTPELVAAMMRGFEQMGQLIVQSRPAAVDEMQMLEKMKMYKDLFGGGSNQGNPFEMVKMVAGLAREMIPHDGPEPFSDTISKLADTFAPLLLKAAERGGLPPPATPARIAAPAAQPATPPQNSQAKGANEMQIKLKMNLLYLCNEAANDADPGPYGAIIVQKVPKAVLDSMLIDPDWIEALAKIHPGVRLHAGWFEELKNAVIQERNEDSALTGDEGGDITAQT